MPIADAARRYVEVMNPLPAIPSQAEVDAVARDLAQRLPLVQIPDGGKATTRAALDAYIALKRYARRL